MHLCSRLWGRSAYSKYARRRLLACLVRAWPDDGCVHRDGRLPRDLVLPLERMADDYQQSRSRRSTGRHSLFAHAVVLLFLFGVCASAFAHEPPLATLGPRVGVAIGAASRSNYRDLLLADQFASSLRASISNRGFSASGWLSRSSGGDSSEVLLSYSHKLPLVDIHVGYAHTNVDALHAHSFGSARLTLSTNVSARTQVDMTFDRFTDGAGELSSISYTRHLLERGKWSLDMRAGATWWNRSSGDAEAWSVRTLSRRVLRPHWELDIYAGFASGRSSALNEAIEDGVIAGLGITWTK